MSKDMMMNILKEADFTKSFIEYIERHFPLNYEKIEPAPYVENFTDNPLLHVDARVRMLESLAQVYQLRRDYLEKNIPLTYFYKSIYDLSYRIERYFKSHGEYGLSERDIRWLTPIFRMDIFDIGVLRFKISHFSFDEIERSGHEYMHLSDDWKRKIPDGTPIITLHIMKDAPITPDKVTTSFQEAVAFFDRYYPEHNYDIFVCRTWLIYEPVQSLLSVNSNITNFAKRFTIIAHNQNTKQALERIYGTSDLQVIQSMNKTSSLQKHAYTNLDKIGEAAGIIHKSQIK